MSSVHTCNHIGLVFSLPLSPPLFNSLGIVVCFNRNVGFGNGKKRSAVYEEFVLSERAKLREMGLCEHTIQKLLCYSNNFLHKTLLTEEVPIRTVILLSYSFFFN